MPGFVAYDPAAATATTKLAASNRYWFLIFMVLIFLLVVIICSYCLEVTWKASNECSPKMRVFCSRSGPNLLLMRSDRCRASADRHCSNPVDRGGPPRRERLRRSFPRRSMSVVGACENTLATLGTAVDCYRS